MNPSARRVAARFAAKRPRLKVQKSQAGLSAEISVTGVVDGEEMYLMLRDMTGHQLRHCESSVEALRERVFKSRNVPIWRVVDVQVPEQAQGKGYGKMLYERALKAAKPAIIVTGGCTGMGTSSAAFRVWKSLSRTYKSEGSSPNDFAIAVP